MVLSEVAIYRKGKPAKKAESGNVLPILTPEYLRGKGDAENGLVNENSVLVEDNDVVLLWDGSNAGEFFKAKRGILASTMVKFVFSKRQIDESFFFHQLKYHEDFLKQQTNGSGIPHVDKEFLLKIKFTQTEKAEQTRIAQILSKADEAIAHTEALIAKYQRIKTGLMQDLLTRGIDENGNIRSEETHEFKDSPLGRIPVEWEVSSIGSSCKIQNQFRKPISSEVREKMKGIYPYYGPTGIQDFINEYRVSGKYVLIGEDGDHFLKWYKQEMTILIEGDFNVNNHAHILEGTDLCSTEWIHTFFAHRDITFHLTRQGAGRYKLNKATLQKLEILLPKPEEQKRVIHKVDSIKNQIDIAKTNLAKLHALKRGLMQDLLSGPREMAKNE